MNIALFGGAFDPPTLAHEEIVNVLARLGFVDQVWVMPCLNHPFGKEMAPFEDRVAMCGEAFGMWKGRDKVTVEAFIQQRLKSEKTVDVLKWLRRNLEGRDFMPVIGLDEANQIHQWHEWRELVDQYSLIVFERLESLKMARPLELHYWARTHHYVAPTPSIPCVSSTMARHNIACLGDEALSRRWKSADEMYDMELSGQVSRAVFDIAVGRGLYGSVKRW